MAYKSYDVSGKPKIVPYDVMKYKADVAYLSNRQRDMERMSAWFSSAKVPYKATSDQTLILNAYARCITEDLQFFDAYPFDLSNGLTWDLMYDMTCRMVMLAAFPGHSASGYPSIPMLVNRTAQVLSAAFDIGFGRGPRPRSDKEATLMRTPYVLDIVCGRGSAWIRLLSDFRLLCNVSQGNGAFDTIDELFKARITDLVVRLSEQSSLDIPAASQLMTTTLLDMCRIWDTQQRDLCIINHDDDRTMPEDSFNSDVMNRYKATLVSRETGFVQGWCAIFGIHAFRCVSCLSEALTDNGVNTYDMVSVANASRDKDIII